VQALVLLLCAMGPEEMSEVRLGPLTPHAVLTLRHIREFFNVQFRWAPDLSVVWVPATYGGSLAGFNVQSALVPAALVVG